MYIAFLLSTGILIGAGFVLALQWVMKREDKDEPIPDEMHELYMGDTYRDPKRIVTVKEKLARAGR